ncbi:hypothetical protein QBC40DRAFT_83384 [Triangularia verruculosa]|uniref:RING-type E3 ubiquitin transferase n=1 Tax=Triangularia verruculosa TaxID=2587418 RepID=A0AAN6XSH6_9PEZI|nr:hypothetical protein QBC40DRAFT_83384 [Triangularia verruculosa]
MMASMRGLLTTSLLWALSITVSAQDAGISWIENAPAWQQESLMHLLISPPESEILQLTYDVYPLTRSVGLNESTEIRNGYQIQGFLTYADDLESMNNQSIALVSCDSNSSTSVVGELITTAKPRAVLLYSIKGNCCALQGSYQDLEGIPYETLFTMANQEESIAAMNSTRLAGASAAATITGGMATTGPETTTQPHGGNNSAVAMSILYSITGLITLLFLVIIATGAIRAHRYPERYGPRSGYGGRPRQSRAKGLARAVLETLPIVKFGDSAPAKPDPALELESQTSRSSPEPGIGTRLSAIPEEPKTPKTPKTPAKRLSKSLGTVLESDDDGPPVAAATPNDSKVVVHTPNDGGKQISEEHLGCSICTEDFLVGEDVRVLPCDHKFHPPCIDPWLINVSGTCPLCRLDLRPHSEQNAEDPNQLAPPLSGEWSDNHNGQTTTQQRRKSLRFLDLHRLRHASVEERIEILRRHRSQQQLRESQPPQTASSGSTAVESEEGHNRRASLADRLRDRFRVHTTRQSVDGETTTTTTTNTATGAGPPTSTQQ